MRLLSVGSVFIFAIFIVLYSSMFVVNQTEQALILQFGKPERVIKEPGLNFKLPFIQK